MMDMNYKHVARRAGFSTSKNDNHNIHEFPIEEARSRFLAADARGFSVSPGRVRLGCTVQSAACYSLDDAVLPRAKCTVLLQVYSALLADIFPEKPGTIAASDNNTRCGLSAAAVAALDPLVGAMGRGWLFTMVALLDGGLCSIGVLVLRRWGKH